ncbi:MAG TPA: hypothetical protein VJT49_06630 [Amycolatopsis sp.]|uniref:hypothetical protein n=1 Tax=Amycolatopsis sp. TaxID=37632 RepID=UPI002B48BDCA|nr:hypothetical protein [Amycolatopsis sp.]HKS44784.1 hypothetical protein [Amycolatopsis sp.]
MNLPPAGISRWPKAGIGTWSEDPDVVILWFVPEEVSSNAVLTPQAAGGPVV